MTAANHHGSQSITIGSLALESSVQSAENQPNQHQKEWLADTKKGNRMSYESTSRTRMRAVKFIVRRDSDDEETYAIITARVENPKLAKDSVFLEHLGAALSKWAKETKEGKKAYEDSREDFNVGDLAGHCSDESLTPFLSKNGIHELDVDVNCEKSCRIWSYDTILIDTRD
jgi:hypothetical protein